MQTSLSSFLVLTSSSKNGQTNTFHLSHMDRISPKQRHWEALERNSLGRKKSKLRFNLVHVLRNDAHLLVYSMAYNMIFYPLSHLIVTEALESRCHYFYFTVEKGGTKVDQELAYVTWGAERETNPRTLRLCLCHHEPKKWGRRLPHSGMKIEQQSMPTFWAWVNRISPLNQPIGQTQNWICLAHLCFKYF